MNKKQALENIYNNFSARTGCGIVIGIEQEFYLIKGEGPRGKGKEQKELPEDSKSENFQASSPFSLLPSSLNAALAPFPFFSEVEKERGEGQLEVQIMPMANPVVVAEAIEMLRKIIQEKVGATFAAKPFPDQPGSAIHININLTDSAGNNLYMKTGDDESDAFNQSIAGLLELMPASMKYFAPYEEAYVRHTDHGMEAPSTVSWGADNRTVSLRVPSVPVTPHTRHIEHRLPCADSDPFLVIAAIIAGIEFGLVKKLQNKHTKIWGNAFLPQYNLQKLPQSFIEAQAIKNEYLERLMSEFY